MQWQRVCDAAVHKQSKHIDIKFHWIRQKTIGGYPTVRREHIVTAFMDADIFTKALEYELFIKHAMSVIGLKELEE